MGKIIFCITGLSGTGKSTICSELNKRLNNKPIIQYTTRPKRKNEIDGIHYKFVQEEQFCLSALVGEVVCLERYNVASGDIWLYGYMKEDIYSGGIIPSNPTSINDLKENKYKVISIKLELPEYVRLFRIYKRKDNQGLKEIIRRTIDDKKVMKKYKFDYYVKNKDFNETINEIIKIISIEKEKNKKS